MCDALNCDKTELLQQNSSLGKMLP
uniref:Uncharacterized protein n=1 Tax=Arundo donax TaxID=35708 RepID=A0A0A8YUW2_ARUDO